MKRDPLYDRLAERGAVFGARNGWERPLYFVPPGGERGDEPTFAKPAWARHVAVEHAAVRERAGLLDMTSFAKYEVAGPGAAAFLDRLCANALPRVGRIALTQMLTPRGGIQCDVTVTRLAEDRFYVISAAATEWHDFDWLRRHLPDDGSVTLENVTERWGVLMIAGPRTREILAPLTDADLSGAAFPFMSVRDIVVADVQVRALRATFTGELGWELHHRIDRSVALYDALVGAGEAHGLTDVGYRVLEPLRLEKGYRFWGVDITPDTTPLEAGLERFVRFDKGRFIGREALVRQRERGIEQTLATVSLELPPDEHPHADAPVFEPGGDEVVGYLLAADWCPAAGEMLALTYLPPRLAEPGSRVEAEIKGERRLAIIRPTPAYDSSGERLRA